MLRARSVAEARLYMNRRPCPACGRRGFEGVHDLVEHGDDLASVYHGYCGTCGEHRKFEFLLMDSPERSGALGGAEPSTLIDAGEFLAMADELSQRVPATAARLGGPEREQAAADLADALRALDEVLKFIPAEAAQAPRSAFFTAAGKQVYLREPARFQRARLESVREVWQELARRLAAGDTAR